MPELEVDLPGQNYGAVDLKKNYKKYLQRAMLIAVFLHLLAVSAYQLTIYLTQEDEPTVTVRIMKYSELGPPPSISDNNVAPSVAVSGPAVKPTVGIPVPIPDAEISPDKTIATQTELSNQGSPVGEGAGTGTIEKDLKIDEPDRSNDNLPPADFVAYEKEPVAVKQVQPKYPELAQRAGMEGSVYAKMWVDKEGKVKKVVVLKSDAEVFNDAAVEAAKQWVFTPALQQKKPVDVWVVVPFRFRLKDAH